MADLIPPMLIKLQADVTDLKAGLAQAESALKGVDSQVKTASAGMGKFGANLKSMAMNLGVAFGGAAVANFAKQTVLAASDMNESISKVQVVFGQSADEVLKFGETAATSLGMSNQKAIEAAGTYGNLFQAFGLGQGQAKTMSTSLVQLAADMASFNNTSVDDAILALRSGLSGETEPLKKFGVALSEVRLKTEAVKLGLISSTKEALTPAAKAQASYALILNDTKLAQGDYARTADGTANTMKTLAAKFQDAKVAIGQGLLPVFRALLGILNVAVIPALKALGKFIESNKEAFTAFIVVLAIAATGWGVYTLAVKTADIAQKLLNGTMKANPIGLMVTAVALLVAGFVALYTKSETFRKVVQSGLKIVINYFAFFVEMMGKALTLASKIPGIGDKFKGVAKAVNDAASSMKGFSDNIGKVYTKAPPAISGGGGSKGGTGLDIPGTTPGDDATKKAASKLATDLKTLSKLQRDYAQDVVKIKKDYNDKVEKINIAYNEKVADINKSFDKQEKQARESALKDRLKVEKEALAAIAQANLDANISRAKIMQDSINLMRDAFSKVTGFDIGKSFAEGIKDGNAVGAQDLIATMKVQLEAIKQLQKNAGLLAAKGYSQQFINEVIAQGPQIGSQLAQAILSSDDQTTSELQSLYASIQDTSNHGLDALALSMNEGGKLATEELTNAYAQVSVDLATTIADINKNAMEQQAEITKTLNETLVELATQRNEALAEARKQMNDDLIEAGKALNDAMTQLNQTLQNKLDDMYNEVARKAQRMIDRIREAILMSSMLGTATASKTSGGSGGGAFGGSFSTDNSARISNTNYTTNIKTDVNATPADINGAVMNAYKFGQIVTATGGSVQSDMVF
jgi:hypothetical protein